MWAFLKVINYLQETVSGPWNWRCPSCATVTPQPYPSPNQVTNSTLLHSHIAAATDTSIYYVEIDFLSLLTQIFSAMLLYLSSELGPSSMTVTSLHTSARTLSLTRPTGTGWSRRQRPRPFDRKENSNARTHLPLTSHIHSSTRTTQSLVRLTNYTLWDQ